jgi:hypothetical protein
MIDQEINSRVDAYRGNPDALQQKYAVSQQLIDLLALQKIKSEMDAKSRDMQLKMAQSGKKPPIAQQLQQEVVGRTKQEMQQQLAGTMQQEAAEKQKALQQVVQSQEQGVAGLPAGNMMPPKAMAAGGIIDFSDEPAPAYEANMASGGIVAFVKGGNKELEDNEAEKRKRLIDRLFPAVIQAESRGKRFDAKGNVLTSKKGAQGAAQVMPRTSRDPGFGVRPARDDSHEENVRVGKEYLDAMLRKYKDVDVALAAYNWGPGNVNKWLAAGADPNKLPAETRAYIPRVKTHMAQQDKGVGDQLAEGVMSLFPSAYAGDKNAPAEQKTSSPFGRFIDDVGSGKVGRDISESVGKATRAIDEAISPKGARERYDAQQRNLQQQREQAAKLFEQEGGGFKQQTPQQQTEADKTRSTYYNSISQNSAPQPPTVDKAQPTGRFGAFNVPEDQFPLMGDQEMMERRQIGVGSADAPPAPETPSAPAPAPEAAAPAGVASLVPPEYKDLATQKNKVLGERLGIDPEEMARQRGIEYYQNVGLPTERVLADKTKRQEGLEALDAERAKYDRENAITEALVNARGSSWQGGLGSFGRNAIGVERRNADLRRQAMTEANTARNALADLGLGVKTGTYGAKTGARKEYEGLQGDAAKEAGLDIRQGMSSQASREIALEQAKQTALWHRAQLDVQNARTEAQKEGRILQYKNDALALLKYDEAALNKLQETMNLALMQNQQPPEALKREFEARKKELQLKIQQINDNAMSRLGGGSGGFQVERIK